VTNFPPLLTAGSERPLFAARSRLLDNVEPTSAPPLALGSDRSSFAAPSRLSYNVERGVKRFRRALSGLVLCEDMCFWGLAISGGDWQRLFLLEHEVSRLRKSPLWSAVLTHHTSIIKVVPNLGAIPLLDLSVVLLEGWTTYLQNWVGQLPGDTPLLLRLSAGGGRFLVPHLHWLRFQHSKCGGVTAARLHIGFRGLPSCPMPDTVRRCISHIIQAKERPRPCGPNGVKPFYKLDDLLLPSDLRRDVFLPSHFSYTGWGLRSLSLSELACAFDLPLWAQLAPEALTAWEGLLSQHSFPPVVIGARLLHFYVPTFLAHVLEETPSVTPTSSQPGRKRQTGATYLPELDRFLPHSWIDQALVSDKAVKADDSEIHHRMWDARITLVLPWVTAASLAQFRPIVHLWWCRSVYRCFRGYLCRKYGADWRASFFQAQYGPDWAITLHEEGLAAQALMTLMQQKFTFGSSEAFSEALSLSCRANPSPRGKTGGGNPPNLLDYLLDCTPFGRRH
jgi:hypothetical protein